MRARSTPPARSATPEKEPRSVSDDDAAVAFVTRETRLARTDLVPELALRLARDALAIFTAAAAFARPEPRLQPYWAFAWPAGQALARHLLDHPRLAAGRSVVDIGAGSGIAAIAALKAGARDALAADIDPLALVACRLNAAANGVELATTGRDPLGAPPAAGLILLGDIYYEPELALRVGAFLERAAAGGATVLFADRTTTRHPPARLELLAEYTAPLAPEMQDGHIEKARVWQVRPR